MRGIGFLLLVMATAAGCVPGGQGGDAGPRLCEVPKCDVPHRISTRLGDPAQPGGTPDGLRESDRPALVSCVAGLDTFENAWDWSEGVVLDLETGEVVFHHVRDKASETVTTTECADLTSAVVMTRLTPPQDWRFGRYLYAPCEAGAVQACGCADGRESTSVCTETYMLGDAFNPDAWSACDCD